MEHQVSDEPEEGARNTKKTKNTKNIHEDKLQNQLLKEHKTASMFAI